MIQGHQTDHQCCQHIRERSYVLHNKISRFNISKLCNKTLIKAQNRQKENTKLIWTRLTIRIILVIQLPVPTHTHGVVSSAFKFQIYKTNLIVLRLFVCFSRCRNFFFRHQTLPATLSSTTDHVTRDGVFSLNRQSSVKLALKYIHILTHSSSTMTIQKH